MSNGEYNSELIKTESILYVLAKLFLEIQQALDKKIFDLTPEFLEFKNVGFSLKDNRMIQLLDSASEKVDIEMLPLLSMISFQLYQISELVVEFAIFEQDSDSDMKHRQNSLYLLHVGDHMVKNHLARIKVTKKEHIVAEFQIDDEIKETLILYMEN